MRGAREGREGRGVGMDRWKEDRRWKEDVRIDSGIDMDMEIEGRAGKVTAPGLCIVLE
jgi:hypothetical protein